MDTALAKLRELTEAATTPLKELYDHLDYAHVLGVKPDDATAAAARRRAEELRAAASGRVDAPMPDGALRRFVQFAKRPELAADYHFANRAQQELPETAALERECPHLAARVDAAIAAELAVGADTFREVSAQATAFFAGVYESIFATVVESERDADLSGGRLRSTRRPAAAAAETRAPTAASNAGAAAAASTSSGTTRVARCLIGVAHRRKVRAAARGAARHVPRLRRRPRHDNL